jgi:heme iron utilization protein
MSPRQAPEAAVRGLIRRARSAALATALTRDDGRPYASLVTVAADVDATPILLLSMLADHTRNLAADARASLLIEEAARLDAPQTGARVSLVGRIARSDEPRHRRRFLARHPSAVRYAAFSDFAVYAMTVEHVHLVGGFAAAHWLAAGGVLSPAPAAAAIADTEAAVIAHMNEDHAAALDLYANRLLGRRGSGWRLIAVDPDGCDLRHGKRLARLDFPEQVGDATQLRDTLIALAFRAREIKARGRGQ